VHAPCQVITRPDARCHLQSRIQPSPAEASPSSQLAAFQQLASMGVSCSSVSEGGKGGQGAFQGQPNWLPRRPCAKHESFNQSGDADTTQDHATMTGGRGRMNSKTAFRATMRVHSAPLPPAPRCASCIKHRGEGRARRILRVGARARLANPPADCCRSSRRDQPWIVVCGRRWPGEAERIPCPRSSL